MKAIKAFFRLLYINHVLAKNGLDQLIVKIHLFSPFRFIVYFNPWTWFRKNRSLPAEALRKSLEQLGPMFVKFGQALSTRPDILPPDIAKELSKLQDRVPPFPGKQALAIIEKAYGRSAYEIFSEFEEEAFASASIAQVHAATLHSGQRVVVKILRPGMHAVIEQDLGLLKTLARLAERYWKESRRYKPKEVVAEFERNLYDELNLQREAANGSQLRRNFIASPLLYIPEIHWDFVRQNVLIMERIYGVPVNDIAQLNAIGVNIKKLAERGLQIFFTQVFRDCFFHADMHPGNIFVSSDHPDNPQYLCVDFGVIGTLNDSDKRYLAENLLAFFNRDYRRIAQLHIDSGWIARNTRVEEFESDIRMVCEPIFEKPLKDISFAHLVLQLFTVARRFDMKVQPQLVLLQKTLLAVEGLGRQLYPDLDLMVNAKPFLEKWLREQMGPKAFLTHCRENLPFIIENLPQMPRLVFDVLTQVKDLNGRQIEPASPHKNSSVFVKKQWYRGILTGLCIALSAVAGLSYWYPITPPHFAAGAVSLALITALLALIIQERSS